MSLRSYHPSRIASYSLTHPAQQRDRIHLFPSRDAALAAIAAAAGRPFIGVAVRFDPRQRRVEPLWTDPRSFDSTWSTPAELQHDGSIVARGPIPEALFELEPIARAS